MAIKKAVKKQTATSAGNSAKNPPASATDKLVRQEGHLATRSPEDVQAMFVEDQGKGSENIGAKDLQIPRISILQKMSPQCDKQAPEYIKGAEPGDFYDNITGTVLAKGDEGFFFIPVSYKRSNIEWIPQAAGGGFVTDHGPDDAILSKTKKDDKTSAMMLPNGHEIVTTAEYFCMILQGEGEPPKQVVISLAKTQLKYARQLNSKITTLLVDKPGGGKYNPAMFYSVFAATSQAESNEKGSWMSWSIQRHGDTAKEEGGLELYLQARHFRDAIGAGKVKAAPPVAPVGAEASGSPEDSATL
jgi:hypothetical protein